MHGQIQPPPRPVIAKGGGAGPRQPQLGFLREMPAERPGLDACPQHIVAQRHQTRAHGVKQRRDLGLGRARLIILQKRVIKIAPIRQCRRLFAFQHQDVVQDRQEILGRVIGAGLGPDALRKRGLPRQFGRQTRRDTGAALMVAGDQLDDAGVLGILGDGLIQPFADARIGAAFMQNRLHRGHFLGALFGRAARHHRFLVPAQAFRDRGQRLGLTLKGKQVVKSAHRTVPRTEVSKG